MFTIVLGVSKPLYSDKELKKIEEDNLTGFEFEGKHYTNYEGTQLQRRIETEIRRQKDTQILAKSAGDMELVGESQSKITKLTHKYNELCKVSGLKPQKQRMSVSGYVRTKVDNLKEKVKPVKLTPEELDDEFYMLSQDLEQKKVNVDNSIFNLEDKELRNEQLRQLDLLTSEYDHNTNSYTKEGKILKLGTDEKRSRVYASAFRTKNEINLNKAWFNDKEKIMESHKRDIDIKWHYKVPEDKLSVYTITHEYGHILEYAYFRGVNSYAPIKELDKDLCSTLVNMARKKLKEKISITEFKNKYWSKYAKTKRNYEWFAETFAKYKLSDEQDVWTETFGEWLEEYFNGK